MLHAECQISNLQNMPRRNVEKKRRSKKPCSTIAFFESQISKLNHILRDKTTSGIRRAMETMNFDIADADPHELIHSDLIKDNSYISYTKHFRGFFKFLALIGDYESMLVFHNRKTSTVTQSMVAANVALYILYKTKKRDDKLTKLDNRTLPVTDVFGNEISCCGDWNYTGNADQFLNAITAIHKAIYQSGSYTDPCPRCITALQSNSNSTGCQFHLGKYKFYRCGNPRYSNEVDRAMRTATELTQNHQSRKCPQLLPSEVNTLRRYLCGTNNISDYQIYVMILLGIYMFLRFDEVANLSFDHYLPEYTVVRRDGYIENLLFKVKGKADKCYVYLSLKRNDEFPHFCPVRHLLMYLHLTAINSGYIFPDFKRKKDQYEYTQFNSTIKALIKDHLGKTDKISTHILRNTGYLFARFGGGVFDVIQRAARHKSTKTALAYFSDAETLFNSFKNTQAALINKVPKWHDIWVNNVESYRSQYTGPVYTLPQLAAMFKLELLGRDTLAEPKDNSPFFSLTELLGRITEKDQQLTTLEKMQQELRKEGASSLLVDIATTYYLKGSRCEQNVPIGSVSGVVRDHVNDRSCNASFTDVVSELQGNGNDADESSCNPGTAVVPHVNVNVMRKRPAVCDNTRTSKSTKRKGTEEIQGRSLIKTLPPKDRLSALLELYEKNKTIPKNCLTGGARTFFYNVLKPVHDCYHNHFHGDAAAFNGKHDLSDYSRFSRCGCNGVGDNCNVKQSNYA